MENDPPMQNPKSVGDEIALLDAIRGGSVTSSLKKSCMDVNPTRRMPNMTNRHISRALDLECYLQEEEYNHCRDSAER